MIVLVPDVAQVWGFVIGRPTPSFMNVCTLPSPKSTFTAVQKAAPVTVTWPPSRPSASSD